MRLLFVKNRLAWPRSRGHDVHGYYMMRALGRLGHDVVLATREAPSARATEGLSLAECRTIGEDGRSRGDGPTPRLTRLQWRFCSYWGIEPDEIAAVGRLARSCRVDTVVAINLDALPYLAGVEHACRVWYAADDPALASLSQVCPVQASSWGHAWHAAVKALYERSFATVVDRAWVVSPADCRAMSWIMGSGAIDVIANGVDGDDYRPCETFQIENSCVFWGRLDTEPNLDAIGWFHRVVWPVLRRRVPDARFTIYGFNPTPDLRAIDGREGVALVPDLPDLRAEVGRHQVVVLPFVSGGGIKNKLLEAASLGKAIVCTPRACNGLNSGGGPLPLVTARRRSRWVDAILALWGDPARRRALGVEARDWVLDYHTWAAAARRALEGLGQRPRGSRL